MLSDPTESVSPLKYVVDRRVDAAHFHYMRIINDER